MKEMNLDLVKNGDTNRFIQGYLYLEGKNNVILSAPHAQAPRADNNTGEIAFRAATTTKSHCLVSTISRKKIDLNYPSIHARNSPYRQKLAELISRCQKRYSKVLLLDIHGMKICDVPTICIGTLGGLTASHATLRLIAFTIDDLGYARVCWPERENPSLIGGDITASSGNPNQGIDAIQLEMDLQLREQDSNEAIHIVTEIISRWHKKNPYLFGPAFILQLLKGAYPITSREHLNEILPVKCQKIYWRKNNPIPIDKFIQIFPEQAFPINNSSQLLKSDIIKNLRSLKL